MIIDHLIGVIGILPIAFLVRFTTKGVDKRNSIIITSILWFLLLIIFSIVNINLDIDDSPLILITAASGVFYYIIYNSKKDRRQNEDVYIICGICNKRIIYQDEIRVCKNCKEKYHKKCIRELNKCYKCANNIFLKIKDQLIKVKSF